MQVTTLFRTCGTLNPSVVIPTQPENSTAQVRCGVLGFGPRVRPVLPEFCQEGLGLRFPWSISFADRLFVSTSRLGGSDRALVLLFVFWNLNLP
jgi:hypothetical protein